MQMDAVVVTPRKSKMDIALENAAECYNYEKYSDFDCHGHKEAKCCSPSCLNQGTNPKKHCDLCGCNGGKLILNCFLTRARVYLVNSLSPFLLSEITVSL